ncbi:TetR family transcriptional regulator [Paraburkholderia sp. BL10I2N1]|uniref:TetR family transcriptional regulator n=1 Tax=Paraburkholderia sp. BL10I2N1 TaxID=1938796 RepID=UPI00105D4DE4|nr:TetR family transcriptional regulator [Paraburkholderia sp. BL10I2N1]TDN70952.1 hypothetical protein B0G77_4472 [Paraburkholderia sp. BL10I2N1]
MKTGATAALRQPRPRDRKNTQNELQLAILRVKNKGMKISITAVAAEAGVTPSLIHNTYPDVAEEIRAAMGRGTRQQRDAMATELAEARIALKDVRGKLCAAKDDIAKLASIHETLRDEIVFLRGQLAGNVRVLPNRKGRQKR